MSHFTVLVMGDNPEKQLAPFQENNIDNCPKEYLEFIDEEEESKKEYEESGHNMVEFPDGSKEYAHRTEFTVDNENKYNLPTDHKLIFIKNKDHYSSFEVFMKEWHKCERNENGRYGYYENPSAKWDWFVLGGRWKGSFKLKKGVKKGSFLLGGFSFMGGPALHDADQAFKKDIDFEGMRKDAEEKAFKKYDLVKKFFGGKFLKLKYHGVLFLSMMIIKI